MAQRVRDVMTADPITLPATSLAIDAACTMRDANIGNVIVVDNGRTCGILTDRDITVRGAAEGRDISQLKLGDICSQEITLISATDSIDDAVRLMRERAICRLPVVEGSKAVGIVSLGDLAVEKAPHSAPGQGLRSASHPKPGARRSGLGN